MLWESCWHISIPEQFPRHSESSWDAACYSREPQIGSYRGPSTSRLPRGLRALIARKLPEVWEPLRDAQAYWPNASDAEQVVAQPLNMKPST
jgi:hypothetical protein